MNRRLTALLLVFAAALLMPLAAGAKSKARAVQKPDAAAETEVAPVTAEVSDAVIAALASGDLNAALIQMRDEKQGPKIKHLINAASRAASPDIKKAPDKSEAHKAYQNIAVAFHNLYLFLKRHGVDQQDYLNQAKKYYSKARSSATLLHKAECDLLTAALLASSGDLKKADKIFGKIDTASMQGDFESMEYIAAYHAAAGQTDETLEALASAHRIDPDRTLTWLTIGDDFATLEGDPRFQGLIDSWHASKKERSELTLSLPKGAEPHLEMTSTEMNFAPQKMMRHASSKEVADLKIKGKSKKSATLTHGKKKQTTKASAKKSTTSKKKVTLASKKTKASAKKSKAHR